MFIFILFFIVILVVLVNITSNVTDALENFKCDGKQKVLVEEATEECIGFKPGSAGRCRTSAIKNYLLG